MATFVKVDPRAGPRTTTHGGSEKEDHRGHQGDGQEDQMDSVKVMAKDDAIEIAGGDEETDQIVNQVLDELGIQMGEEMAGLPSAAGGLDTGGEKIGRQAVAAGGGGGGSSGGRWTVIFKLDRIN